MRGRRPDLFAPDCRLQVRMCLAATMTPLLVLASVAAVVILAPEEAVFGFLIAVTVGICGGLIDELRRVDNARPVSIERAPRLHGTVDRLCVMFDLPKPDIVIEDEDQPNSWTVAPPRKRARLHVTTGLLALLNQSELEAVIAHELAHLAHRDAAVMSLAAGPGGVLFDGARRLVRGDWWLLWAGLIPAGAIGWVSRLATLALSRRRELAADAGSAMLTGRPMALACALCRICREFAKLPEDDLRLVARRDVLHLLPVDELELLGGRGATATHPPLTERIERLERLERQMHRAHLGMPEDVLLESHEIGEMLARVRVDQLRAAWELVAREEARCTVRALSTAARDAGRAELVRHRR